MEPLGSHRDARWLVALVGRPVDLVEREGLRNPFRRDKIMQTRKVIYVAREG